jgi:hypothetical protein
MKIYLAARFSRQQELRNYAFQLRNQGHEVTSRWLEEGAEKTYEDLTPDGCRKCAQHDVVDIKRADCVISFTETRDSGYASGGRHVELGIALASGKSCLIVGPQENVFHHLSLIHHFTAWEECLDWCATADMFMVRR